MHGLTRTPMACPVPDENLPVSENSTVACAFSQNLIAPYAAICAEAIGITVSY
jgi:hypothetical protein